MSVRTFLVSSVVVGGAVLSFAGQANAQLIIKNPKDHPDDRVELDVHGDLAPWHLGYHRDRYYYYRYSTFGDPEFGAGFYAAIKLADPAFIPSLNNTIAIMFGADVTNCFHCYRDDFRLWTPVAMQWNFYLTQKWSVFADIGFMLFTEGFYHYVYPDFFLELGGRLHFNDHVALNLKIGYPFFPQVGVSFNFGK